VVGGKRIVGGFVLVMLGLGIVLDTPWGGSGGVVAAVGAGLLAWGAAAAR
jgi:hypothetical protein